MTGSELLPIIRCRGASVRVGPRKLTYLTSCGISLVWIREVAKGGRGSRDLRNGTASWTERRAFGGPRPREGGPGEWLEGADDGDGEFPTPACWYRLLVKCTRRP